MENTTFCESPVIIVNPAIWEAIHINGNYYFDGQRKNVNLRDSYNIYLNHPSIFPHSSRLNKSQLDSFYSVSKDGEITPAYIYVPCGHCELCRSLKVNEWSQRMLMEAQLYDLEPLFITLTYNDEHLPKDGVSKVDCQLFLKRLRHRIPKFRYYLHSEYGTHGTHRPHYHLILFGNINGDNAYLSEVISQTWQNGFIQCKRLYLDSDSPFEYVCKYACKSVTSSEVPIGKNPNFALSSRGNGGIGFPKFKEFIPLLREVPRYNEHYYQYLDKWSGKIQKFRLNSYFLRKVFPSLSYLVDYSFRVAFRNLSVISRSVDIGKEYCDNLLEWLSGFNIPKCLFPSALSARSVCQYVTTHKNFIVRKSFKDIQKRIFRVPTQQYIDYMLHLRDTFLSSLPIRHETDLTPIIASYHLRRQCDLEKCIL